METTILLRAKLLVSHKHLYFYFISLVPAILDVTVGFRKDGAEPTLLNIIQGKQCKAEMYVRSVKQIKKISDSNSVMY